MCCAQGVSPASQPASLDFGSLFFLDLGSLFCLVLIPRVGFNLSVAVARCWAVRRGVFTADGCWPWTAQPGVAEERLWGWNWSLAQSVSALLHAFRQAEYPCVWAFHVFTEEGRAKGTYTHAALNRMGLFGCSLPNVLASVCVCVCVLSQTEQRAVGATMCWVAVLACMRCMAHEPACQPTMVCTGVLLILTCACCALRITLV